MVIRNVIVSLVAAGASVAGAGAQAQTAPAATAGTETLGEIVVTAQRREQKLEDVPMTIQVVSTDLIQKLASDQIGDMSLFVPGLVVSADSPTQPHYQLRGIGASDFGVGTDPAVGVYVDGVYAARSGASLLAFNDIERIEVLKGPQGTLFGRSSAAGAISVVTRKPSDVFEGSADLRIGNEGKERIEGMLNAPLGDGMALRFNAVANKATGYIHDAATGADLDPEKNWASRVAFRWDVSPNGRLIAAWNHDDVNQLARPPIGLFPLGSPGCGFPLAPTICLPNPQYTGIGMIDPIRAPVYNDTVGNAETRKLDEVVVTYEHRFGGVTFQSTTDWRQFRTLNREGETGTESLATYFDTANIEHNDAWYQEFKLSGKASVADWVAGVSWSYEHAQQANQVDTYTDTIDTVLNNLGIQPGGLYGPVSAGLAEAGVPISLMGLPWQETMYDDGRFKSLGVFADVIWHVSDSVNLTTGVRYSRDSKDFTWLAPPTVAAQLDGNVNALNQLGVLATLPAPLNDPATYMFNLVFPEGALQGVPYGTSGTWTDVSPRAVLDYKVAPNVLTYLSVAKGFTPGGFDGVKINGQYAEETVWNYEAGIKSTFPDAHVLFNAAIYHYAYKNKQALVLSSQANSAIPEYNVSLSDQKATGVDLEFGWKPVSDLTFGLTAAYIDSKYTKFQSPALTQWYSTIGDPPDQVNQLSDLSGQPTGEPSWSFAANLDYVIRLPDSSAIDLFVDEAYRGAMRCNDESQATLAGCLSDAPFKLGAAQSQTNARVGWRTASNHWGVALYVSNLFNERYVTSIDTITASTLGTPYALINAPRRYGIELHAAF